MKYFIFLTLLFVFPSFLSAKVFSLLSPDGRIQVQVEIGENIRYNVLFEGTVVLEKSPISMTLSGGKTLGKNPRLLDSEIEEVRNTISSPVYKRETTPDNYNELSFTFQSDYGVIFRAYDDGIAYRFVSTTKKAFTVENEEAVFNFPRHSKAFVTYVRESGYHDDNMGNSGSFEEQFFKSFVNTYQHFPLEQWDKDRLAFMPLLVETAGGVKICLTEADLINYPGMYLNVRDRNNSVHGVLAPYPKSVRKGGDSNYHEVVTEREHYLARFEEGRNFPWRTLIMTKNEVELLDNDMVYRLASETVQEDISWIKPGKSAWEWWNDKNIYGVDFKTGINNETYKHYIDFAAKNNLEYLIMDEGWYEDGKIFEPIPELDLAELIDYARQREVGIILWTGCYPFKTNMEEVCRHYAEMGIKGFKVDFMDRDDQEMVRFHYETAAMAAKYQLVINFHGTYKPTGLQRTYPNVLTVEAVQGLEHMKWASPAVNQVEYDVIMPYIRMLAGPLDYTQGAMRNANRENYKPVYSEPMSQGTRARQVAKYIVFESPLSMLSDSPSAYEKEQESVDFIAAIPTVWDDSRALDGAIAKYL